MTPRPTLLLAALLASGACAETASTDRPAANRGVATSAPTASVATTATYSTDEQTAAPSGPRDAAASVAPPDAAGAAARPLSHQQFRALVAELSEPDAEFFSDNFISNETSYLQPAAALRQGAEPGGAYLGVGPEQNFTYLALTRPARAYLIDIRRDNLVLHLLYKAIFDLARSRAEFLSLLTGRPYAAGSPLDGEATVEQVIAHAELRPASLDSYQSIHRRLRERIVATYGFDLDRRDLRSLDTAHRAFYRDGLSIRFELKEESHRRYPPLRELLAARDPVQDEQLGFLADEQAFRFVQRMQRDNRVVPLVGNFGGDHTLPALAEHLRQAGLTVSVFYVSNVEQYLLTDGLWWKWTRNVEALPTDDESLFVRCYLNQGRAHPRELAGHRTTTVLQRMAHFLARNEERPYRTMYQLSTDDGRLPTDEGGSSGAP